MSSFAEIFVGHKLRIERLLGSRRWNAQLKFHNGNLTASQNRPVRKEADVSKLDLRNLFGRKFAHHASLLLLLHGDNLRSSCVGFSVVRPSSPVVGFPPRGIRDGIRDEAPSYGRSV